MLRWHPLPHRTYPPNHRGRQGRLVEAPHPNRVLTEIPWNNRPPIYRTYRTHLLPCHNFRKHLHLCLTSRRLDQLQPQPPPRASHPRFVIRFASAHQRQPPESLHGEEKIVKARARAVLRITPVPVQSLLRLPSSKRSPRRNLSYLSRLSMRPPMSPVPTSLTWPRETAPNMSRRGPIHPSRDHHHLKSLKHRQKRIWQMNTTGLFPVVGREVLAELDRSSRQFRKRAFLRHPPLTRS